MPYINRSWKLPEEMMEQIRVRSAAEKITPSIFVRQALAEKLSQNHITEALAAMEERQQALFALLLGHASTHAASLQGHIALTDALARFLFGVLKDPEDREQAKRLTEERLPLFYRIAAKGYRGDLVAALLPNGSNGKNGGNR